MYICHLVDIFTYLFGTYLKTGNKPAFIYLDLFDKLAKTDKKKDSRFRMSPVMRGFALDKRII